MRDIWQPHSSHRIMYLNSLDTLRRDCIENKEKFLHYISHKWKKKTASYISNVYLKLIIQKQFKIKIIQKQIWQSGNSHKQRTVQIAQVRENEQKLLTPSKRFSENRRNKRLRDFKIQKRTKFFYKIWVLRRSSNTWRTWNKIQDTVKIELKHQRSNVTNQSIYMCWDLQGF